ncbi:MAG: hypothetical protein PHI34_14835, partial [Acidobacteriota bacterium]|nr:hypothetical protein [Acidobacteriota bacterium]
LVALLAGAGWAALQTGAPADPASFLPPAGRVPGWEPYGDIQKYQGDDLFVYIDGGAEIYHEYGFRRVAAWDYKNAAGKNVSLEIFEMTDAPAAFGAFTFKASGRGRAMDIGQGADLEDYYLNFWQGRYQVTATGSDDSPESLAGVMAISRAAASLIPAGGPAPDVFSRLPRGFDTSPHRKYIKGVIGLYNIHPFFTGDVLRFADAAAAEKGGEWVFLFRYASESEAEARFPEIRKALESAGKYKDIVLSPLGTLTAVDDKGRGTAWKRIGAAISAALTGAGPAAAEALIDAFR